MKHTRGLLLLSYLCILTCSKSTVTVSYHPRTPIKLFPQRRTGARRRNFRNRRSLPSHMLQLPRACKQMPCQKRAVSEVRETGCTNVILFESLFMIKATCSKTAVAKLSRSPRFTDITPDEHIYIAAPTRVVDQSPNSNRSAEESSAHGEPATDSFERVTTLSFSNKTLADGRLEEIGLGNDGSFFSFHKQSIAARCSRSSGQGVTVYVIDTGCRTTHSELAGRAIHIPAPGSRFRSGVDDHGHGTHIAATIAGRRFGLAREARVVCIKALSERNEGSSNDVVAGIQLAIRMHRQNLKRDKHVGGVISISLGVAAPRRYKMLDNAIDLAAQNGLVSVVAAGNAGQNACSFTPARARNAITVAAVNAERRIASFSNRGPCVTVGAPGVHVWSATMEADDRYARSSGTSMAVPFVSGLVALVLGNEKGITTRQVTNRLRWMGDASQVTDFPSVSVAGYCRYELHRWRMYNKEAFTRQTSIPRWVT